MRKSIVLEEARRMNHGPEWIKEIMDYERAHDNIHIDIGDDAIEQKATVRQVKDAFRLHIGIIDWCVEDAKKPSARKDEGE